jgi:RelB Antitoxin alpha helical domain
MNIYPFVQEFVTDKQRNIIKVILNFQDYQNLIDNWEDQALYQAMLQTKNEQPLSLDLALEELEKNEN